MICRSKEIKVFTFSTGQHNSISWIKLRDYSNLFWMKKPISSMIWYPSKLSYVSGERAYRAASFLFHYMPAYILDFPALLLGRKASRVLYSSMQKFIHSTIINYCLLNRYTSTPKQTSACPPPASLRCGNGNLLTRTSFLF